MGSRGILHTLYEWLYEGKSLDAPTTGVLVGMVLVTLIVVATILGIGRYNRALKKWKHAGGASGEQEAGALPADAILPAHDWQRVRRAKRHRRRTK